MSLGWVAASVRVRPFELSGTERAALNCLAEQTPKGSRRSWATQDDLMATTNITTLSGIAKVLKSLAKREVIRQVERGKPGQVAAYELAFDEWVYDPTVRRWVAPENACPSGQPSDDPSDDESINDGCPDGQANDHSVVHADMNGCPDGQPHQEIPRRDTEKAAAGGGDRDQLVREEPSPDVQKILKGCGQRPDVNPDEDDWAVAAREALARGGHPIEIIGYVMDEIHPSKNGEPIRSVEAIRLHRLRKWPGKAPQEPAHAVWGSIRTEYPRPPAPADTAHLCPEHGHATKYLPTGACEECLIREHPELAEPEPPPTARPGRLDPTARAALKTKLNLAEGAHRK